MTATFTKNQANIGTMRGAKGGFELIERNGGQIFGTHARNSDLLGNIGPTKFSVWRPYTENQQNAATALNIISIMNYLGNNQNE